MARTIYAFLVGIDDYFPPVTGLNGCKNDVKAIEGLLNDRATAAGDRLELTVLVDRAATRDAVMTTFRDHLGQAGPGDTALFYYSGHGSQEQAPPEHWHLEPDHLNETLVCADSRTEGSWDLADKELAALVAVVAERAGHTTLVLDCCHSGSGTRALDDIASGRERRAPVDQRARPITTYSGGDRALRPEGLRSGATGAQADWLNLATGRHVLLAACRSDQTAKEVEVAGQQRGVLSASLERVLRSASGALTYRDLHSVCVASVAALAVDQTPLLEVLEPPDVDQPFLGGVAMPPAHAFVLSCQSGEWSLDGGSVHGLPDPTTGEVRIAVYDLTGGEDPSRATGILTAVHTTRSDVELATGGDALDPTRTYRASVTSTSRRLLATTLLGIKEGVAAVRTALSTASGAEPSTLVGEVQPGDPAAELTIVALAGGFRITRVGQSAPMVADVDDASPQGAALVVARLEHIARWRELLERRNPGSTIPTASVELQLLGADGASLVDATGTVEVRLPDGAVQADVQVRVANPGGPRLYCALLALTEDYGVTSLLPGGGAWLEQGEDVWVLDRNRQKRLGLTVAAGRAQSTDILKLFVSTREFDAQALQQDEIPRPTPDREVAERGVSLEPAVEIAADDWVTKELVITTLREASHVAVTPAQTAPQTLAPGVMLLPHPALQATVGLSTPRLTSRDVDNVSLPSVLLDATEPLVLQGERGPGGSERIVVGGVVDRSVVTHDQPLRLTLSTALAEGEHVAAFAFDGELWLPVGGSRRPHGDAGGSNGGSSGGARGTDARTEIHIDRLPEPVGVKDLFGSLKVVLRKVVLKPLGLGYDWPRLLVVEPNADGTFSGRRPADGELSSVTSALVVIHGIIGDTKAMVEHVYAGADPIASRYDVVLSFDYENLDTGIDRTAQDLRDRLHAAGLTPDGGQRLDILAHSMGGLVTRCFVEREGGNAVVRRVVTAGTPHHGSPWPNVQQWATMSLAAILNGVGDLPWPGAFVSKAVGWLIGSIENFDTALDQMDPGSELIKVLANAPDPGIPYVAIAGNRALVVKDPKRLNAIVARLDSGVDLLFAGQPNDFAVLVSSAEGVPAGRTPPVRIELVASDHFSYFSTEEGLRAVTAALRAD